MQIFRSLFMSQWTSDHTHFTHKETKLMKSTWIAGNLLKYRVASRHNALCMNKPKIFIWWNVHQTWGLYYGRQQNVCVCFAFEAFEWNNRLVDVLEIRYCSIFFFLDTLGNNMLNEWTNSKYRKILWSKARLMALSWNSQNWPDERLQFSSDLSFHCLLREGRKKSFARIQMWSMAEIHRMFIPLWCYTRGSGSLFSYPIFFHPELNSHTMNRTKRIFYIFLFWIFFLQCPVFLRCDTMLERPIVNTITSI